MWGVVSARTSLKAAWLLLHALAHRIVADDFYKSQEASDSEAREILWADASSIVFTTSSLWVATHPVAPEYGTSRGRKWAMAFLGIFMAFFPLILLKTPILSWLWRGRCWLPG